MQPNFSEKTAINFVWAINYAKWGEKTLKKIIQNYKNEKQGLQTEKLDITDIIPNHGENYDDWHGNVFYVQNIISWGMKFPENPVRIFKAFADSASLVSFAKKIKNIIDSKENIHKLEKENQELENSNELIKIQYEKNNLKRQIFQSYIENNKKDFEKNKKQIKKLKDYIANSQEYKNYLENKEFYDNFIKKVNNIIPQKDFQQNLLNNNQFDHNEIEKLLIEFIQKKYETNITLDQIKEEYKKTFESFEKEFKTHNHNF